MIWNVIKLSRGYHSLHMAQKRIRVTRALDGEIACCIPVTDDTKHEEIQWQVWEAEQDRGEPILIFNGTLLQPEKTVGEDGLNDGDDVQLIWREYHEVSTCRDSQEEVPIKARYVKTPGDIKHIRPGAFKGNTGLQVVKMVDSVTTIGHQAFFGCKELKHAGISPLVTCIDFGAFSECSALVEIVIPESVISIPPALFRNCTSLKRVVILGPIKYIGTHAFSGCTALRQVVMHKSVTSLGNLCLQQLRSTRNRSSQVTQHYRICCLQWMLRNQGSTDP